MKYTFLSVRYVGGSFDAYIKDGKKITPPFDMTKAVVLSKHEDEFLAIQSVERHWHSYVGRFVGLTNNIPFFMLKVSKEEDVKIGDILSVNV